MPDISAIASAVSAFKAVKDIGESMIGLRDAAAFQSKLLEFQSKLIEANNIVFAAQDERSSLLSRINELERRVSELEAWKTKADRYELKNVGFGSFAYQLKPAERGDIPAHWVCTNCFEGKRASILQLIFKKGEGQIWTCPSCKSTIDPGTSEASWID